jgi:hypothetical protein
MSHVHSFRHAGPAAARRTDQRPHRMRSVAPPPAPAAPATNEQHDASTLHAHILQTAGRTPVVRLARREPPHVEMYAKREAFNPLGSVKDRMARHLAKRLRSWKRRFASPGSRC